MNPKDGAQDPTNLQRGALKKYILIRLGASLFGVPLSSVREVIGLPALSSLPNMPPYFAGLINLRGKIISAIDLKKSLGSITAPEGGITNKRPTVVVIDLHSRLFGVIVDEIAEVISVYESEVDHSTDEFEKGNVYAGIIKQVQKPLAPILNLERAIKLNELLAQPHLPQGKAA